MSVLPNNHLCTRNGRNGAVLVRAGQPEMGIFGWRNSEDEALLNAIPAACALNPGRHNSPDRDATSNSGSSCG